MTRNRRTLRAYGSTKAIDTGKSVTSGDLVVHVSLCFTVVGETAKGSSLGEDLGTIDPVADVGASAVSMSEGRVDFRFSVGGGGDCFGR